MRRRNHLAQVRDVLGQIVECETKARDWPSRGLHGESDTAAIIGQRAVRQHGEFVFVHG